MRGEHSDCNEWDKLDFFGPVTRENTPSPNTQPGQALEVAGFGARIQHQGSDLLSLETHLEAILCLDKGEHLNTVMVEEVKGLEG